MLSQIKPYSKVVVRADLDVPVEGGVVTEEYRLERLIPTLHYLLSQHCSVLIIGHMGRPIDQDPNFSLAPIQKWLQNKLSLSIPLYLSGFSPGEWWVGGNSLSLLENLRFFSEEGTEDVNFARQLITGADCYVYEAFASYRPSTSTHTIPKLIRTCSGLQFDLEIEFLSRAVSSPISPSLLIVSGAKKDKLELIKPILSKFDHVFLGGLLGSESDLTEDGLDISSTALSDLTRLVKQANTIIFNGPLGRFEDGVHTIGTRTLLELLKKSNGLTLLGGGDTLSAMNKLGFSYQDFDFVSTGGGAMLEYLVTGSHPVQKLLTVV